MAPDRLLETNHCIHTVKRFIFVRTFLFFLSTNTFWIKKIQKNKKNTWTGNQTQILNRIAIKLMPLVWKIHVPFLLEASKYLEDSQIDWKPSDRRWHEKFKKEHRYLKKQIDTIKDTEQSVKWKWRQLTFGTELAAPAGGAGAGAVGASAAVHTDAPTPAAGSSWDDNNNHQGKEFFLWKKILHFRTVSMYKVEDWQESNLDSQS